jgi:rubrerythrin
MLEEAKGAPKAVKKAFAQTMKTDGEHAALFKKLATHEEALHGRVIYVCRICGHIEFDAVPDHCPVCYAVRGRFERVD